MATTPECPLGFSWDTITCKCLETNPPGNPCGPGFYEPVGFGPICLPVPVDGVPGECNFLPGSLIYDPEFCGCRPECTLPEVYCDLTVTCVTPVEGPCHALRAPVWNALACAYDYTDPCPVHYELDLDTCLCVPDGTCPAGYRWCPSIGQCVYAPDPHCLAELNCTWDETLCVWSCEAEVCPGGGIWDPNACACIGSCPAGYEWCEISESCVATTDPRPCPQIECTWNRTTCVWDCADPCPCPTGWTWVEASCACVPDDALAPGSDWVWTIRSASQCFTAPFRTGSIESNCRDWAAAIGYDLTGLDQFCGYFSGGVHICCFASDVPPQDCVLCTFSCAHPDSAGAATGWWRCLCPPAGGGDDGPDCPPGQEWDPERQWCNCLGVGDGDGDLDDEDDYRDGAPWLWESLIGQYHEAQLLDGKVLYKRSDSTTTPFRIEVTAAEPGAGERYGRPRMVVDWGQQIRLLFNRLSGSTPAVVRITSDDDGATWSSPAVAIPNGRRPTVNIGPATGVVIEAAYVNGQIHGTRQYPGDPNPSAVFTFNLIGGVPLAVASDTFHLAQAREEPARWVLVGRAPGSTQTRRWQSVDDCATWEVVA